MHSTNKASFAAPPPLGSVGTARQAYPCSDDRYTASLASAMAPHSKPTFRAVYNELVDPGTERLKAQQRSLALLRDALETVSSTADDLPASPDGLTQWMVASAATATRAYRDYLSGRRSGAPRRFFTNRTHALYFLQAVAPTKLVDGSWLYGCMRHARDPRMAGLVQTYLEELGNGDVTKNHVLLYRELLRSLSLGEGTHLADDHFKQGALQLALGHATEQMLPEVIGFNLGYEQLPLHLLITAYELNELGLDPYYFTLHVTVDNADSGHARKAVEAVLLNAGRFADRDVYWDRVRRGYRLNDLGVGTTEVVRGFDLNAEVLRIFCAKSGAGAGAHSDYCRIEGRTVNEWLAAPALLAQFAQALVQKGWIVHEDDPAKSRFWRLLIGGRAEMFGVFSDYELQAIFDWIRGSAAADGHRYDAPWPARGPARAPSFRATQRLREAAGQAAEVGRNIGMEAEQVLLSPGAHWTPAGLDATRQIVNALRT